MRLYMVMSIIVRNMIKHLSVKQKVATKKYIQKNLNIVKIIDIWETIKNIKIKIYLS